MTSSLQFCLLVAFLGSTSACGPAVAQREIPAASIRFHTVDSFGHPVPYKISHFRDTAGNDLVSQFRDQWIRGIPIDSYEYELTPLQPRQFGVLKGRVTLLGTGARWMTLAAREEGRKDVSYGLPRSHSEGVVKSLDPSKGPAWLRLMWAFDGRTVEEVPLGPDGTIHFYQTHTGKFILVVHQGADILYMNTLEMDGIVKPPIEIDVSRQ